MSYNRLIPMIIGIVLTTNTVSLTIQRLSNLEDKAAYTEKANKRRLANQATEIEFKVVIRELERDLKDCEKN